MPRVTEATHASLHPNNPASVLLLRLTTNPMDPTGAFGVLKEITKAGFDKHYAQQCRWIDEKPVNTVVNSSGIDAIVFNSGSIMEELRATKKTYVRS